MPDNKDASGANRDKFKYDDYDDERAVLHDDGPSETKTDFKSASRGDESEEAGTARRTASRKRLR